MFWNYLFLILLLLFLFIISFIVFLIIFSLIFSYDDQKITEREKNDLNTKIVLYSLILSIVLDGIVTGCLFQGS